MRACVRPSILSNMNISETSGPITTKFYLKHNWGEVKAALGFGPDRIRTLVSMATYTLFKFFDTMILPILTYGAEIWFEHES